MVAIDRHLASRETQLKQAMDLLTEKHGAHSETVALIRARLDEVQTEIIESRVDHTDQQSHTEGISELMGGPKVKDAAVMYVILGGVIIFAISGVSTMFLVLMAVRLGAL